jgi:BirA family biotin operon repressor/biotin-[acetyl-CoA-carboxylase] ligase
MDAPFPWTSVRADDDRLDPAAIEKETPSTAWDRLSVVGFAEIGSTNDEAARLVRGGAPSGLLVFAEHQNAGKGRMGRSWASPRGSGLCFSLVVHPSSPRQHWPLLSLLTSVAVARSIEDLAGLGILRQPLRVDLKWPNDVLLSGRKVAGILVETAGAPGGPGAVVIGVGVNVGSNSVPPGMEDSATSVSLEAGASVPRRPLLVSFLRHFQQEYLLFESGGRQAILDHWKAGSSMWNGVRVFVSEGSICREATTCGLTESGAIRVRLHDGSEETLLAADVSMRIDNRDCRESEHE